MDSHSISSPSSRVETIRAWLLEQVASRRGLNASLLDPSVSFLDLGLDSVKATALVTDLGQWLGRQLNPTLLWEYPTVNALARHLAGEKVQTSAANALTGTAGYVEETEPIAIVGLACRFPSAPNAEAFWRNLIEGRDSVREVPPERWDAAAYYDPRPGTPGKIVTRQGAFLDQVDQFDPQFFGISPREACQMDPQQRLMLEVSWEALEDAGVAPRSLRGSRTGVFFGVVWRDYADLQTLNGASATLHTCPGHAGSIVANRVSYALGLEGPSMAIDTACSSSLVAIHEACRSLRAGETSITLAGGIALNLSPRTASAVSAFGALSSDGRCKTFAARADGYGRGEGAGIVVLKPLSRAQADGDNIYCLIRGSAVNNDGASNGLTAPSPKVQERLLCDAYHAAGVDPGQVQYVELHGTGTPLGDPIEANALGAVMGTNRPAERPLHVGSVKTNIGHLEAAAGIAGLIKVALSIRHRQLPPSIHFDQPNPHIPLESLNLRVQSEPGPWPVETAPLVAGISSFGFGGTNSHVVVEEYRPDPRHSLLIDDVVTVLPLDPLEAGTKIESHFQQREAPALPSDPRIVFVFAGAGSAWWGMGRDLLGSEPLFRARLETCDAIYRKIAGWSLLEEFLSPRSRSRLNQGEVQLPLVLSFQVALAALWRDWGIEPDAVLGYSVGEWAAAQAAGILTLEETLHVAYHYVTAQQQRPADVGMAVVGLPVSEAERYCAASHGRIAVSAENGPRSSGIGGEMSALRKLVGDLSAEGLFARIVDIDFFAHIPQVEPLAQEFIAQCPGLYPGSALVPMVSTVTGDFVDGRTMDARYWAENLRRPVRLGAAMKRLLNSGYNVFLDVNPHPIHAPSLEETTEQHAGETCIISSLHRGEPSRYLLYRALAQLSRAGRSVRWHRVFRQRGSRPDESTQAELFAVSARTEKALRDRAAGIAAHLRDGRVRQLGDLCYTAGARLDHLEHRLALVTDSLDNLAETLVAFSGAEPDTPNTSGSVQGLSRPGGPPRLVFVFSGQGSFPIGRSAHLLDEPIFRESFERCHRLSLEMGGPSLIDALRSSGHTTVRQPTETEQPVLFAYQIALVALWRSWGINNAAVVGHSVGEVAAAYVAGGLSLEDALRIVICRSRLMGRAAGLGRMASVNAPVELLEQMLEPYHNVVAVAAFNGPGNVVLSGEARALAEIEGQLRDHGHHVRDLHLDYAFHSPQMFPFASSLETELHDLKPAGSATPFYSTVTGQRIEMERLTASYWRDNLSQPVLFAQAIQSLIADGSSLFLEISPHPILFESLNRILEAQEVESGTALFSVHRDRPARTTLLNTLGALYVRGLTPDWRGVFPSGGELVPLPAYPWQHARYWFDESQSSSAPIKIHHPLLGRRSQTAESGTLFEAKLRADSLSLIGDHRLYGTIVVAGATLISTLLSAAGQLLGDVPCAVRDLLFVHPIVLEDDEERLVQLTVEAFTPEGAAFQIASDVGQSNGDEPNWTIHARGWLDPVVKDERQVEDPAALIQERCTPLDSAENFYTQMKRQGIDLERQFRWLEALWQGEREALGRLRRADARDGADDFRLHPGIIDSCFQTLGAVAGFAAIEGLAFVPFGIQRFIYYGGTQSPRWCHLSLSSGSGAAEEVSVVDLRLFDDSGLIVAEVEGLAIRRASADALLLREPDAPLPLAYHVEWPLKQEPARGSTGPSGWLVLKDDAGLGTSLAAQIELLGGQCILLERSFTPEEILRGLATLADTQRPCEGIIDLRGLEDCAPLDALDDVLKLTQLMVSRVTPPVRLFLVTRGGQSISGEEMCVPSQSSLWGLGHVIAAEHPELRCVRIDLDPESDPQEIQQLALEVTSAGDEDRLALRANRCRVARLARLALALPEKPLPIRIDATYVITGGLGGLGLEVAAWMVKRGARHLVLLGRSEPEPQTKRKIEELRAAGAEIVLAMTDVANREAVSRALGDLRRSMPPLRGIVHAAGALKDGVLLSQDRERFAQVLAPKVDGALNLHQETQLDPLDFFVLFSSAASLFGTGGQAAYAAANAFLDGLAHQRRHQGLPATSINWGPWSEIGMATRVPSGAHATWKSLGMSTISPRSGLKALERALLSDLTQVMLVGQSSIQELDASQSRLSPFFKSWFGNRNSHASERIRREKAAAVSFPRMSRAKLISHLQSEAAKVLGLPRDTAIDPRRPLREMGLDSMMAIEMRNSLASSLGRELSATLLFDHPSLERLLDFLAPDSSMVETVQAQPLPAQERQLDDAEPIAVIGMACRLPGGVRSPDDFWRLLSRKGNAISEVPPNRWRLEDWYDPDPETPGKMYSRFGGFMDDVESFDAPFFGISTLEANSMDPQQRLLLEVCWEALESAGLVVDRLAGSATGVFLGMCLSDYGLLELNAPDARGINAYSGTGGVLSVAAGRIAYAFGLEGPAFVVDTACSSSLVSTHLACQSLRRGECDLALAGGVNLLLSPQMTVFFSKMNALSPDGACKAFDESANGYVRGEGCGMVVLKRLSEALADGDPILALIRGSAVNQDGRSNGLTAPNRLAQERVIQSALAQGGVAPWEVSFVETHGTGTQLGDPIEVGALAGAFGQNRRAESPLAIGSVKSNIGHLEGAAGIAGLLKVILALQHRELPASLHFNKPNPLIPWDELPVTVVALQRPWHPLTGRRIAGVSSFGFSGTNAHIVLEEAPARLPEGPADIAAMERTTELLVLSARSEESLSAMAQRFANHLSNLVSGDDGSRSSANGHPSELTLHDVCYSASVRRSHHDHRLAVVAETASDAIQGLQSYTRGEAHPYAFAGYALPVAPTRTVFLFSGQGGLWPGTGRALLAAEPVFRDALEECDDLIQSLCGWSLLDEFQRGVPRFDQAAISQPAHFSLQVALTALLNHWGVKPDAVVGASLGEVAAAYAAGALSLGDAMRVAVERSRILQGIAGQGAMVAVELPALEIEPLLEHYRSSVSIAAINSPTSTLISGEASAIDSLLRQLEEHGIFFRRLGLDYPSHSPLVAPYLDSLKDSLAGLQPFVAQLPLVSTVTGSSAGENVFNADYWQRNLREPVRLASALATLAEQGHGLFVELGPHPVQSRSVYECFEALGRQVTVLPTLRRDELERHTLLGTLGALYVHGLSPDWSNLHSHGGRVVPLPSYAWQDERYWVAKPKTRRQMPIENMPLHGRRVRTPVADLQFEARFDADQMPLLADHQLYGKTVVAGAVHIAMVLSAASEINQQFPVLTNIAFPQTLALRDGSETEVSLVLSPGAPDAYTFRIQSLERHDQLTDENWALHAEGQISINGERTTDIDESLRRLETARSRCGRELSAEQFYQTMEEEGIKLGKRFRWIERIWQGEGEALCKLRMPEPADQSTRCPLNPGLIDSVFQTLRAVPRVGESGSAPYVPISIERLRFFAPPTGQLWAHARLYPDTAVAGETLSGDLFLFSEDGQAVATIEGLVARRATRQAIQHTADRNLADLLFNLRWTRAQGSAPQTLKASTWIILSDRGDLGSQVTAALERAGHVCHLLTSPQQSNNDDRAEPGFEPSLREALRNHVATGLVHGVVYLRALDLPETGQQSPPSLAALAEALQLVQITLEEGAARPPRLWLVTKGAQPVSERARPLAVAQSPLWGLVPTLHQEHPELRCVILDLDPDETRIASSQLFDELTGPDAEDRVAYRRGTRLVPRLAHLSPAPAETPVKVTADGAYLITGGLGALGLLCARWLSAEGARHIVLLGRHEPSETARREISALRSSGVEVRAVRADVSRREEVADILLQVRASMPRLRGVIHAAGLLDDALIRDQDWDRFRRVLSPKVTGSWALDQETSEDPLDFFILFSSMTSLLGAEGQSNYGAANAFMDALAFDRRARGLPAIVINWGPWANIGLAAARTDRGERLAFFGIESLEPERGTLVLDRLLRSDAIQTGVIQIDWQRWRQTHPEEDQSPLLGDILREQTLTQREQSWSNGAPALSELARLTLDERRERVLAFLRQEVTAVLALRTPMADGRLPLVRFGFDSFTALKLKGTLDLKLGVSVSVPKLLSGLSLDQLVGQVLEGLEERLSIPMVGLDTDGQDDMEEFRF